LAAIINLARNRQVIDEIVEITEACHTEMSLTRILRVLGQYQEEPVIAQLTKLVIDKLRKFDLKDAVLKYLLQQAKSQQELTVRLPSPGRPVV